MADPVERDVQTPNPLAVQLRDMDRQLNRIAHETRYPQLSPAFYRLTLTGTTCTGPIVVQAALDVPAAPYPRAGNMHFVCHGGDDTTGGGRWYFYISATGFPGAITLWRADDPWTTNPVTIETSCFVSLPAGSALHVEAAIQRAASSGNFVFEPTLVADRRFNRLEVILS